MTLGVIGVQQAFGRRPLDHLGQLPSQVHSVLNAGIQALSARRVMHMRRVARQQDPPFAIGGGLTRRVGEPGDPDRTVDPVVRPIHRDQRLAEITQGRFGSGAEVRFGHEDPHQAAAVKPAQAVQTGGVVAHSPLRLLGQLDLGDQVADRRIPPGELDAGCFPDHAASAVAPDEILGPQRLSRRTSATSTPVSSCAKPVTSRPR